MFHHVTLHRKQWSCVSISSLSSLFAGEMPQSKPSRLQVNMIMTTEKLKLVWSRSTPRKRLDELSPDAINFHLALNFSLLR